MKPRNIVLTGFMGAGKSEVARALGKLTGYKPVELDKLIEERAGVTIAEIFATRGEPAFRDMESAAIRALAGEHGLIVSTGGGAVVRAENRAMLREAGAVVLLAVSPETVYERTRRSTHRPLLNTEDPLGRIRELMKERETYYREAEYIVNTEGKGPLEVAEEVLEALGWRR